MQPIEIFTVTVLMLAALHLLVTTCRAAILWWQNRGEAGRAADQAQTGLFSAAPVGQRSDWYVFFHCRDLTGAAAPAPLPSTRPDQAAATRPRQQPARRSLACL